MERNLKGAPKAGSKWNNLRKNPVRSLTSSWRPRHPHEIIPSSAARKSGDLRHVTALKVSASSAEKGKMGEGGVWSILLRQGGLSFTAVWYTWCQRNGGDTVAEGREDGTQITLLCLLPPGMLGSLQGWYSGPEILWFILFTVKPTSWSSTKEQSWRITFLRILNAWRRLCWIYGLI